MIHILPFEKWWVSKHVSSSQTLKFAEGAVKQLLLGIAQKIHRTCLVLVSNWWRGALGRTDLGHFHCHVIFLAYRHGEGIGYMMIYYVWYVYLIQLARHGARMRKLPHRKCGLWTMEDYGFKWFKQKEWPWCGVPMGSPLHLRIGTRITIRLVQWSWQWWVFALALLAVQTSWYQRFDPIPARARNLPIVFSGFPKGSFLFGGTLMRGQQPLEELEKMALSRFSRVRVGKGQAGCSGEKTQLGASPVLPRRSRAIPLCRGQRIKWAGCSVELHRPAWVGSLSRVPVLTVPTQGVLLRVCRWRRCGWPMATLHTASMAQKYPKTKDQVAFK